MRVGAKVVGPVVVVGTRKTTNGLGVFSVAVGLGKIKEVEVRACLLTVF